DQDTLPTLQYTSCLVYPAVGTIHGASGGCCICDLVFENYSNPCALGSHGLPMLGLGSCQYDCSLTTWGNHILHVFTLIDCWSVSVWSPADLLNINKCLA
ncbi:unnamed protein product, partial [Ectocarpus fasciculatus]